MPISPKPFDTMLSRALIDLQQRTNVTYVGADGRARILLELPLNEVAQLWQALSIADQNSYITTADGIYLDAIGELLGIRRITATRGTSTGASFKFYVQSVQGEDIIIPIGTRVWSPTAPAVAFTTTATVVLSAGSLETYVPIQSEDTGAIYSAGSYTLSAHDVSSTVLKCTNLFPITSGQDEESDDDFRYRISQACRTWARCNVGALRTGLLTIPGVRDIILRPYARGTGSVDVIIYSDYPTVSTSLLTLVQGELDNRLAAFGIRATAIAPTVLTVDIEAILSFRPDATTEQRIRIRQNARVAVTNYLDNLLIGNTMYLDQIERAILNSSEYINEARITSMVVDDIARLPSNIPTQVDERIVAGTISIS